MLPSAYEFHWDLGHIFFLGIFYGVVIAVFTTLGVAAFHWLRDLKRRRGTAIDWMESFHDLPMSRRHCRHEFDGAVSHRICHNGFDCASCHQHEELAAEAKPTAAESVPVGLGLAPGRLYHRGHTWVEPCEDGTLKVGLDEFAGRCFGHPDYVTLPTMGTILEEDERSVFLRRGRLRARISTPVAGEVVAQGNVDDGWLYKVRPADSGHQMINLLKGDEARVWMVHELEWLQRTLTSDEGAPTLADGGTPVDDLMVAYPAADWDNIWGQVSLEA